MQALEHTHPSVCVHGFLEQLPVFPQRHFVVPFFFGVHNLLEEVATVLKKDEQLVTYVVLGAVEDLYAGASFPEGHM